MSSAVMDPGSYRSSALFDRSSAGLDAEIETVFGDTVCWLRWSRSRCMRSMASRALRRLASRASGVVGAALGMGLEGGRSKGRLAVWRSWALKASRSAWEMGTGLVSWSGGLGVGAGSAPGGLARVPAVGGFIWDMGLGAMVTPLRSSMAPLPLSPWQAWGVTVTGVDWG